LKEKKEPAPIMISAKKRNSDHRKWTGSKILFTAREN